MGSRFYRATKLCAKLGIFGGTVYLVTANGLWGSDTADQGIKALQDFGNNVDQKLGTNYVTNIKVPSLNMNLAERWNSGVAKTADYAANLPEHVATGYNNGREYVSNKFK